MIIILIKMENEVTAIVNHEEEVIAQFKSIEEAGEFMGDHPLNVFPYYFVDLNMEILIRGE